MIYVNNKSIDFERGFRGKPGTAILRHGSATGGCLASIFIPPGDWEAGGMKIRLRICPAGTENIRLRAARHGR